MARGVPQAPRWAWVVMVIGVVALGVGVPLTAHFREVSPAVLSQARAADATARAAEAAASSSAAAVDAARLKVAVLGDSYTAGSPMDSGPARRWPALVSTLYGWKVQTFAEPGTGFINGNTDQKEFASRVPLVIDARPDVVIVEGGHNDVSFPAAQVSAAADSVVRSLRAGLPTAKIVVVGVLWPGPRPAQPVVDTDAMLHRLADKYRLPFIDPLADGWLLDKRLIGSDGTHPTDAGHAALAADFEKALLAVGLRKS